MAASKEINHRLVANIRDEPEQMLKPISGYDREPLVSIEKACEPLEDILDYELKQNIIIAKMNSTKPKNGLTSDEAASIHLYTMEWDERENSLYMVLNKTLRLADRIKLRPWFKYLKLFLTGFFKLPPTEYQTVWRGVQGDLSTIYSRGKEFTWWALSSCTSAISVLESPLYVGTSGPRTMFSIETNSGRYLKVIDKSSPAKDLHIIHLREIQPPYPMLAGPFDPKPPGEPRTGKMVHATIHETERQLTIQTEFRKPKNLSQPSYYITERSDYCPMNNERSSTYSSTFDSDDEYVREKPQRTIAKKRPQQRPESATISESDNSTFDLIKLLEKKSSHETKKPSHQTDVLEKVKRLVRDKKANGNARNKEGHTILQLAVRNGHYECLETLIQDGGAKLDKRGIGGNTALHECCLLGSDGTEPLRILLRYGGDATWVNDKKQSVIELASKKSPELIAVIASNRGEHMVDRQTKSHYDDH